MIRLLLLTLICSISATSYAQKLLQLEKAGTLRTTRFYVGEELTFRMNNDDTGWHTRVIRDFDMEKNRIVFQQVSIPLDSIEMIQLPRTRFMRIVGTALQVGGINMILFSTFYSIREDREADWATIGSGLANIVVGTLFQSLFKTKRFKPGKRKRLRLLDLRFQVPDKT